MKRLTKNIFKTLVISLNLTTGIVLATHNTSRYFPLLERMEDYTIKGRQHLSANIAYLNASSAHRRGGSTGGIPELWGNYNLKDVISSLLTVNPGTTNPIITITGTNAWVDKDIKFRVGEKVHGWGLVLDYEYDTKFCGLQLGASLPVFDVHATSKYSFDRKDSDALFNNPALTPQQQADQEIKVDSIRRLTHQTIGFDRNIWSKTGFGDMDVHLRWNHIFDHKLLMRSIDVNIQTGVIVPTGFIQNNNIPASLPIGSNDHWGMYGDFLSAFELKQDWTFGLLFGFAHLFPETKNVRLPVGSEPAIFSSLTGRVRVEPGFTFKFSPYFTLGNLTDGLDLQVRYTYLRHGVDTWKDMRSDKTIASYLTTGGALIGQKEGLSLWRAHYITLQLTYDAQTAMKHCKFDPVWFVGYDMPFSGNGITKMHQLNLGAELHF